MVIPKLCCSFLITKDFFDEAFSSTFLHVFFIWAIFFEFLGIFIQIICFGVLKSFLLFILIFFLLAFCMVFVVYVLCFFSQCMFFKAMNSRQDSILMKHRRSCLLINREFAMVVVSLKSYISKLNFIVINPLAGKQS